MRAFPLRVVAISTLGFGAVLTHAAPVTFSKDVAPILQERCQECHLRAPWRPCRW